jgi:hypothetical protein
MSMATTITIRYYNRRGTLIHEQRTTDAFTKAEVRRWAAWLNDSNVEQVCEFDQYSIVACHHEKDARA